MGLAFIFVGFSVLASLIGDTSVIRGAIFGSQQHLTSGRDELLAILNHRSVEIVKYFDQKISEIERMKCAPMPVDPMPVNERRRVFDPLTYCNDLALLIIRGQKRDFLELHSAHISALQQDQVVLAREIDKKIQYVLTHADNRFQVHGYLVRLKWDSLFEERQLEVLEGYRQELKRGNLYARYRPSG